MTQTRLRWQGCPQAAETHADAEDVGAERTADAPLGTAAAHSATSPGMQTGTVNMRNV